MKLLVGNKSDLEANRQVKTEEGKNLADSLGIKFLETSAKDAVNVEKAFTTLSNEIKSKVQGRPTNKPTGKSGPGASLKPQPVNQKKSGCCWFCMICLLYIHPIYLTYEILCCLIA